MSNQKYITNDDLNAMRHKVAEFMTLSGQQIAIPKCQHTWGIVDLRIGLLKSEIDELEMAFHTDNMDLVVDGLCDILYVAIGNMLTFMGHRGLSYSYKNEYPSVSEVDGKLPHYMVAHRLITYMNSITEFDEDDGHSICDISTYSELVDRILTFSSNHGIDILGAFNEVHQSNMTKFCYDETESLASILRYEEKGIKTYSVYNHEHKLYVIKNCETDKVLKGLRFREPNLKPFY